MNRLWLVTGASGLLGANFLFEAAKRGQPLCALSRSNEIAGLAQVRWVHADLTGESAAISLLERYRPAVVFHLAAQTDVDWCEGNPEQTYRLNTSGTRLLAKACAKIGARMVYMSTDAVFDGRRGLYTENDLPSPVNVYSRSKLDGEIAVRDELNDHVIVRANIFGWNALPKKNLSEWILGLLSEGKPVPGFTNSIFAPLLANTLAAFMIELAKSDFRGIVHAASRQPLSKFRFAQKLASVFNFPKELVEPRLASDVSFKAQRPQNTSLAPLLIEQILRIESPSIDEEMRRFYSLRGPAYPNSLFLKNDASNPDCEP